MGVILDAKDRSALLSVNDSAPIWVGHGGTIDGWTVESIESDHVAVRRKSTTRRVNLYNG